jgi:hypothetical protein
VGATNQPEDWGTWKRDIERQLRVIRDRVGNVSAFIGQGGLTVSEKGFIRTLDSGGFAVFFTGPDVDGRAMFTVGRPGALPAFDVLAPVAGAPIYWRLRDRAGRELISDDPVDDNGLARPFLDITMYPMFAMAAGAFPYMNIAATSITAETQLWQGRLGLVSHPRIRVYGIWGQATGANSCTYRLKELGEATIGTWSTGPLATGEFTFDIATYVNRPSVPIELTAQATGTGLVACQVIAVYLKGTDL